MKRPIVAAVVTTLVVYGILYMLVPAQQPEVQTTAYDEIRDRGAIRVAYALGAPLLEIDPNTERMSGIFYEIVEGVGNKLDLDVDWTEEVGYGEMIQGLKSGRYDIFGSGVWLNAARGKEADFSIPAYYDAVFAYVKEGDTRFEEDLSKINSPGFTISTMDGELGAAIAATDFPDAETTELPQTAHFSQMILNVVNGKADVVFLALGAARAYQAENPNQIRVAGPYPLRVFPVSILLPKGAIELKHSVDYALIEMLTNGEVEAILRRYDGEPGSYLRTAPPYRWSKAGQ